MEAFSPWNKSYLARVMSSTGKKKKLKEWFLSGWTQSPAINGESTSMRRGVDVTESSSVLENPSKKRRLSETQTEIHKNETENVESRDDLKETEIPVMMSKKKRVE